MAGTARIGLDQAAQTRNLHIHAALVGFRLRTTRQFNQALTRQRLMRMAGQRSQQGENSPAVSSTRLPSCHRLRLGKIQPAIAKADDLAIGQRCPGAGMRWTAQHRMNAGGQLAGRNGFTGDNRRPPSRSQSLDLSGPNGQSV